MQRQGLSEVSYGSSGVSPADSMIFTASSDENRRALPRRCFQQYLQPVPFVATVLRRTIISLPQIVHSHRHFF
jgi:hypothetical protein